MDGARLLISMDQLLLTLTEGSKDHPRSNSEVL